MTELLEQAVDRIRALSPERQDDAARVLFHLVGEGEPVLRLTPAELADLEEAQLEMERGEFATEAEVAAVFAKYRL